MANQGLRQSGKGEAGQAITAGEIRVMVFGQLTDVTRTSRIILNNISDTDQMIGKLEQQYPGLKQLKYIVVVDHQMITGNVQLKSHNAVALLPPFSGG